jgi:hypothetical protein
VLAAGLLVATLGCAQPKSPAPDTRELQLTARLLGTWVAKGGFVAFGERAREVSGDAIEVWICRGRDAFDLPTARQFCSWGVAVKQQPSRNRIDLQG